MAARPRIVVPVDAARRKFLIAMGIAYVGIGFSYAIADPTVAAAVTLRWLPGPFGFYGLVWIVCGFIAIVSSFVPTTRDKPGFLCLSIPPSIWAMGFVVAQLLVWFTDYSGVRAWVSAIIFGVIALAVDTVSGMIDSRLVQHEERVR